MKTLKKFFFVFFILILEINLFSQESLKIINRLNHKDDVFKEYISKVNESYKFYVKNPGKSPQIDFYIYYGEKDMDFFALCARLNLRHETLATLNRITSPDVSMSGKKLIIPTANGLFIPHKAASTLEHILKKKCFSYDTSMCYNINGKDFDFVPDGRFDSTERAFFLDVLMRSPLPQGVLTSDFGTRTSPISGQEHFHGGIDLAAPEGTSVLACKSGLVFQTGFDRILGNFILLNHDGKNQSLYAHLNEILVKEGDTVTSGKEIGKVGTTGASTGPHLHFEIRNGGRKINPKNLIKP